MATLIRAPAAAVRSEVVAAGAVLVVAVAAVLAAHGRAPTPGAPAPRATVPSTGPAPDLVIEAPGHTPWWIGVVVLFVVAAAGLAWVLVRHGVLLRGAATPREATDPDDGSSPPGRADLDHAADVLAREAAAALDAGRDPREVVVACWVRLEAAAEQAGLGRRPAETASDVVRRWLPGTADPAAARELVALYHRARWSEHPLTDDDRRRARAALHGALAAS